MPPFYSEGDRARIITVRGTPDGPPDYRTGWRRDYGRVIHSPAFRRLQGKTQLFAGAESDFFRNRLTHSLEAAQIAKSIALRINHEHLSESADRLEPDIAEIAALCHDLGHPPFGHNGEKALDECMKGCGGFEGNAQTLRILARLEKREPHPDNRHGIDSDGRDHRCGLNLTARVLASVLKYDKQIPYERKTCDALVKGYYRSERIVVDWLKEKVTGQAGFVGEFKTIECQIMDVADDIAYSTYDLEDALKAGFLIPLDVTAAPREILEKVGDDVAAPNALGERLSIAEVREVLTSIFGRIGERPMDVDEAHDDAPATIRAANLAYRSSRRLADDGYLRVSFTSQLVGEFIRGVTFSLNTEYPALSTVALAPGTRRKVEVLKRFNFVSLIMSPRLKVAEYRGGDIVRTVFDAVANHGKDGHRLLPDDFQYLYERVEEHQRRRVVCDFIAGMTDRYALEFYGRLRSENPQSIFKPL